jgi:hypothetical protein
LHVCDIQFVGMITRLELGETYYRTATFVFDGNDPGASISAFLFTDNDRWGFGLDVEQNICTVELHYTARDDLAHPSEKIHPEFDALPMIQKAVKIKLCVAWRQKYIVTQQVICCGECNEAKDHVE